MAQDLSQIYLQQTSVTGDVKYDSEDRPLAYAYEAEEYINQIIGAE